MMYPRCAGKAVGCVGCPSSKDKSLAQVLWTMATGSAAVSHSLILLSLQFLTPIIQVTNGASAGLGLGECKSIYQYQSLRHHDEGIRHWFLVCGAWHSVLRVASCTHDRCIATH